MKERKLTDAGLFVFRPRQWTSFWILSPYLGPLVANGVLAVNPGDLALWHWGFGQFAVLSGVSFIALCLFADETWYATSILCWRSVG
jgi:hypothetical protein